MTNNCIYISLYKHNFGLAFRRSLDCASLPAASLAIYRPHLYRAIRGAQGVLPWVGWGVTASQLDLPSLTLLSLAGCARLQLGATHWATSVALLQIVDNYAFSGCNI